MTGIILKVELEPLNIISLLIRLLLLVMLECSHQGFCFVAATAAVEVLLSSLYIYSVLTCFIESFDRILHKPDQTEPPPNNSNLDPLFSNPESLSKSTSRYCRRK